MSNDRAEGPRPVDLITLNRGATVARLVSGVFHELNNALQVIGGTTELLQDTPGMPEAVAKGLQRIHGTNARAASAISDVMLFVRQKTDARGRVNMRDLVSRAVALRAYAISRARLTIAFDPPKDGKVQVEGNAILLQQAVLNLIANAEQSLAGRPDGAIRLELALPDGWVVFRVADNGPGVDRAMTSTIFEPFVTTRVREESSGLGLTVARAIAEQLGGTLTMEETPAGASFVMRLPAV